MAHIYFMARLLPATHPYLSPENIGRFGVRHVIVEASRNLKFSIKNIDQIFIYFAMLAGVLMLLAQFLVFIYAIIISPAMAFSWFDTLDPSEDIAYNLLDQVFGVPGIFCSSFTVANCTAYATGIDWGVAGPATGAAVIPLPYHTALHGLFQFYSTALLSIAVLIFLYFVVVIIFETATSGTPFGERFQNVWVPVRLVVALGLLMPVGHGLGSGQYLVLYAAKYGSSFATTGWKQFNDGIAGHSTFASGGANPAGESHTMLAIPEAPDITTVVEAMSLVHACAYTYHRMFAGKPNQAIPSLPNYAAYDANYTDASTFSGFRVMPYFVKNVEAGMVNGAIGGSPIIGYTNKYQHIYDNTNVTHMDALGFYFASDIVIRFGEFGWNNSADDFLYRKETGNVKAFCGDIRIPVVDLRDPGGSNATPSRGGSDAMLKFYYNLILELWFDDESMRQFARSYVEMSMGKNTFRSSGFCANTTASGVGSGVPGFYGSSAACEAGDWKPVDWRQDVIVKYQTKLKVAIREAWSDYVNNSVYGGMSSDIMEYGWGGAGVWYNKIAEVNGGWISAVAAIPLMDRYPLAMEQVYAEKKKQNESIEHNKRFDPTVKAQSSSAGPSAIKIGEPLSEVAKPLSKVYDFWNSDDKNFDIATRKTSKNIFMEALNRLMGTGGLAAMRTSNAHLHPLAQLVMVGKGLVDSAVTNLAGSTGSAFLGGMAKAMGGYDKSAAVLNAASDVLLSTAFMGLTAGFVLYYILPFMPFVYFYFAVASWIKAIFEAMVGVPLWALAHLRIDGDGLPGEAAQNGYFLILDIFIRPILTVVGLVAAVIIFSTQVRVLNLLWDLVVSNTSGHTPTGNDILGMNNADDSRFQRSVIDQFFFTVIYTIVCYMMALASFKLIDKIPDNILRWAGSGVTSFGDINQDNVDSLSRYAAMGGMTIGNQAAGAVKGLGSGAGSSLGTTIRNSTSDSAPSAAAKMPPSGNMGT